MPRDVRLADSITQPGISPATTVIAGSHGGISSGRYAGRLGLSGVVFNDSGVGKDAAGIRALWYLDELGLPAATVDYESARIGDGVDTARNGSISHINETAGECGCAVGQHALRCARIMHDERIEPPEAAAGNETTCTTVSGGSVPVWTIDSIGSITDEHKGTITVTGSHGERLAGEFRSYRPTDIAGITLFDAGVGKDDAGIGRLRSMDERDIPAAAVDVDSARIGESTSAWREGVFSHVNDTAASLGVSPRDGCPEFVESVRASKRR
jgi:hypothetical protein